jgi:hypothetical protein
MWGENMNKISPSPYTYMRISQHGYISVGLQVDCQLVNFNIPAGLLREPIHNDFVDTDFQHSAVG